MTKVLLIVQKTNMTDFEFVVEGLFKDIADCNRSPLIKKHFQHKANDIAYWQILRACSAMSKMVNRMLFSRLRYSHHCAAWVLNIP